MQNFSRKPNDTPNDFMSNIASRSSNQVVGKKQIPEKYIQ